MFIEQIYCSLTIDNLPHINSMCGKLSKWSLPSNNLLYAFQLNLNFLPMQHKII